MRIFLSIFFFFQLTNVLYAHEQVSDEELLNTDTGEVIHSLVDRLENQDKIIDSQKITIDKLSLKLDSALYHLFGNAKAYYSSVVSGKNRKYNLTKVYLPFNDYYSQGSTPVGFLESKDDKIILATGSGFFFTVDKNDILNKRPRLLPLPTNFHKIISNRNFYSNNGAHSIKDILIKDGEILVSYTNEKYSDCYNLSIISATINYTALEFYNAFQFEECASEKGTNPHEGGGRMVNYKGKQILLSVGNYGINKFPQDKNSIFGKIIAIDIDSGKNKIVSMGHRNPQGLYYDEERDVIISTEHGPNGGDEININLDGLGDSMIENYGWPISSYGTHYDGKDRTDAPLYKSHVKYGFKEPILEFTPSIAISEIIKFPSDDSINDFLIGSLGYSDLDGRHSLHYLQFDESYKVILFKDVWFIGDRIRDLLMIDEKVVLMLLEGDHKVLPSLGLLELDSNE